MMKKIATNSPTNAVTVVKAWLRPALESAQEENKNKNSLKFKVLKL